METNYNTKFKLMYKKKTKLNLVIEQEEIVETIETDIVVRDDAPPTIS